MILVFVKNRVDYPFPLAFAKTTSFFDLIHVDIWGRYHHASQSGAYHFLSIVGDYSRGV